MTLLSLPASPAGQVRKLRPATEEEVKEVLGQRVILGSRPRRFGTVSPDSFAAWHCLLSGETGISGWQMLNRLRGLVSLLVPLDYLCGVAMFREPGQETFQRLVNRVAERGRVCRSLDFPGAFIWPPHQREPHILTFEVEPGESRWHPSLRPANEKRTGTHCSAVLLGR